MEGRSYLTMASQLPTLSFSLCHLKYEIILNLIVLKNIHSTHIKFMESARASVFCSVTFLGHKGNVQSLVTTAKLVN